MPISASLRRILLWLIVTGVLSVAGLVTTVTTAHYSTKNLLERQLPGRLDQSLRYSFEDPNVLSLVSASIQQDLGNVTIAGHIELLKQCNLRLVSLAGVETQTPARSLIPNVRIPWQRSHGEDEAVFSLHCSIAYPTLIGANALLALLMIMTINILPIPLNFEQRHLMERLDILSAPTAERKALAIKLALLPSETSDIIVDALQHGQLSSLQTRLLLEDHRTIELRAANLPWLKLALQLFSNSPQTPASILSIAQSEPLLEFRHSAHTIVAHGITIILPRTPYFYYAWYAIQRASGINDGWVLNPSTDRPDKQLATSLIALMKQYGGHQKAVNDLLEHGVRGKILDQNRNKVKDELVAVLGHTLAADYLFTAYRDARSGRYRYRLTCQPDQLRLTDPNHTLKL